MTQEEDKDISAIFRERLERLINNPAVDPDEARELREEMDSIDPSKGITVEIGNRKVRLLNDEVMLFDDEVSKKVDEFFENKAGVEEEELPKDIRAIIKDMKLPGKIKLGMFGDATCRMILIRDASKLIQDAVLSNAKITPTEIEAFAKNTNVSDGVLRVISNNKTWTKEYAVKLNLVTNPKTPQDLSMKWVRFLNKSDLRKIAKSKNLPQLIANTARKRLADAEK